MSSIMRRRSGLMGFSLIGSSCLEVEVDCPLDPQDGASARHLRSFKELSYCGRRNRPTAPPAPPAEAGSFSDTYRTSPASFKIEHSATLKVDVFGLCNQVTTLGTCCQQKPRAPRKCR